MDAYLSSLIERGDLVYEKRVESLDAQEFERARQRAEEIEGGVVVATTNDAGEVLLVENDWMDGYGFPGGGVEPGEGWETAATREVLEETGVAVKMDRPWRVVREVLVYGDERLAGHSVLYRASPIDDESVATDPGTDDEVIEAVGWFDEVPERAVHPDLIRAVLDDE